METEDNLAKFGNVFQAKCVVALLTDKEFLEQSIDIVSPKFFESDALAWIVERIFWYYNGYRTLPTLEVFKTEIDKITHNDVLKASATENLRTVYRNIHADDVKYIKKEFLEFCKNQALKNAILKSVDLLQNGKYDDIKILVDQASRAGAPRNLGHDWVADYQGRIAKASRNVVATRWDVINNLIDGGLGAGELCCFIGGPGAGKSWILQDLGQYAASQGKTVAHYTLELSDTYTGIRYDTIMTGIAPQEIKNNGIVVEEALQKMTGKVRIKYFPARSINVNAIHSHIKHMMNLGEPPDLVIIDYADLMRSVERVSARHEELGLVYEEIRGMLGEFQLPGYTVSQSQRSASQDDVVEADKVAGSFEKIMKCDAVFSLSRKSEDKVSNTARMHCIKNRFGSDGLTFPVHMDTAKGEIFVYDSNSPEGAAITARSSEAAERAVKGFQMKMLDTLKRQTPPTGN